ncbi:GPW/gp25 family protein [Kovacikia minuta CCNUW1]|uniref:GPW/gp25 family protein n=1 Tax=Kovacikia minuta TaxID=2931930 RepID=UPI001CCFBDEC|nr:GPW/gp25 family protein [Kovacikia minuta]UBF27081.1 GPW/gp25 family protein [Kovacikia minuta CCNUW1]
MGIEREKLFGNDLQLGDRVGGFDLFSDNEGDLSLAEGNENIAQALSLRLQVRQGELAPLGIPNYGSRLHELIGEPNNRRTQVRLMAFARQAIAQDPRVEKIQTVQARTLAGDRDVIRLEMEILLIRQPNPFNLVYDLHLETP